MVKSDSILLLRNNCLIIALVAFILSCDTEPICETGNRDFIEINFQERFTNLPLGIIAFDEISSTDLSSPFYTQVDSFATFRIPLNPLEEQVTLVFRGDVGYGFRNDTLELAYRRTIRVISEACGGETFFTGLRANRSTFDSLVVREGAVRFDNLPHLTIYFE